MVKLTFSGFVPKVDPMIRPKARSASYVILTARRGDLCKRKHGVGVAFLDLGPSGRVGVNAGERSRTGDRARDGDR